MIDYIPTHPKYLMGLNDPQIKAVMHINGPLLVLAGAGTGKTKVLTSRAAHIINSNQAYPNQIMAVTFTNKAANEMKHRLGNILEGSYIDINSLSLGTFHSIGAKILRKYAHFVGLDSQYTIIDYDDQLRLIKQLLKELNIDEKALPPKLATYLIGRLKDNAACYNHNTNASSLSSRETRALYDAYQNRLKALNACDFGDLLLYNLQLLKENEDVRIEISSKFKYIMVDEYQDTNTVQYQWLKLMVKDHNNICCVGDDDQSIYGWRGANVQNILGFHKDFPGAEIVRLECNYRSTPNILKAASVIIANNKGRHGKTLWTATKESELIKLNSFVDEREEARYVSEEIESLARGMNLSNVAILVRAGYQTRAFEESMNFLQIPYRIVGGMKFYERMEIKDALAYIRVLVNSNDSLAFERIVNLPRRGVGPNTLEQIHDTAKSLGIGSFDATKILIEQQNIKGKSAGALQAFFSIISECKDMIKTHSPQKVVEYLLNTSGYIQMWKDEGTEEANDKLENIKELVSSLQEFDSLSNYLEHISLITDIEGSNDDRVSLMTIHAAKGLEFDAVFLVGWETGIFPSQKAIDENHDTGLEEERRLAYVAITRAKYKLYISYACNRRVYGQYQSSGPSIFIKELPQDTYEKLYKYESYYQKQSINKMPKFDSINPIKALNKSNVYSISAKDSNSVKLKVGDMARHERFGIGKVLHISDMFAEISFDIGVKKVLIDFLSKE